MDVVKVVFIWSHWKGSFCYLNWTYFLIFCDKLWRFEVRRKVKWVNINSRCQSRYIAADHCTQHTVQQDTTIEWVQSRIFNINTETKYVILINQKLLIIHLLINIFHLWLTMSRSGVQYILLETEINIGRCTFEAPGGQGSADRKSRILSTH